MVRAGSSTAMIAVLVWSTPLRSQDLGAYHFDMALNGLVTNQIAITQTAIGRNATRSVRPSSTKPSTDRGGASAAASSFRASLERRRVNYSSFLAKSRAVDPQGASSLEATLAMDPIAMMEPELAKVGLRTNDVADAYAVYWVEAWEAAHGKSGHDSREMAQAVRRQAADAVLAVPGFAAVSDVQKQEFADALLVQALLISAAHDQARGDEGKLRQVAAAVRQGARAAGLELDGITLTENGFIAASG